MTMPYEHPRSSEPTRLARAAEDKRDRGVYVQFGCGLSAPSGWRNFDASPTLRLQRLPLIGRRMRIGAVSFPANVEYGDVVTGLPIASGSCAAVYCSHVLEHLALSDLRRALAEAHRILAPGGRFRLVLPDLELLARNYLAASEPGAASQFMRSASLGKEQRHRTLAGFVREWLGNSNHLWMWDFKGLREELINSDFTEIRRARFGDSDDPRFREVEAPDRWDSCLGIECRR